MAQKKCPTCGAMVSDASQFCEQCGSRLTVENATKAIPDSTMTADNAAVSAPNKKKSGKAIAVISIFIAILILGGCALYFLVLQPRNEAKKFDAFIEKGQWSEAIAFIKSSNKEEYKNRLSECYYNLGKDQMSAEKWEEAVDSFSLSNEADTSELLDECYKHIKSDYSFQEVFEECIAFRCSDEAEDMTGADISQAELEKLKPFVTADFYSADLKNIAQKYYKALELQHNYYVDEDGNYDVEDWRDAYLTRMSIIYQLIKDYDFFADNIAVRDEYTEYGEEAPLCIKAERDLDWQRDNDFDNYFDIDDDGQVYFTFRNDQDYNISVHVDMYYDYEDGEEEGYYWDFPRVKANSTFTLTIPERNPDKEGTWSWSMFFDVLDVVD